MALILVQSGLTPMGEWDGLDSITTSIKGGEVGTFTTTAVSVGSSDLEAADVEDGYVGTTSKYRAAITTTMVAQQKPVFLLDEGTTGYGTLFGQVVGGSTGQSVTSGSQLGPHTATGSGKITVYGQQGFYASTLDACDTAADGLVASNSSLTPNVALTYTTSGKLTPATAAAAVHASNSNIARLVEFSANGSLVNTPSNLVAAVNSPSGSVSSVTANRFTMAIYWFQGALA